MSWLSELQKASWRGVPFGVLTGQAKFGRRTAVHEYPFKDKPWVEDLGRSARPFNVTGFLVTDSLIYGGGDVIAQREKMIAAAETAGSGILVHPTYGQLTVSLVGGMDVIERWDAGRYFELQFAFVEAGERVFPAASSSTGDAVTSAASASDTAASSDFSAAVISI